MYAQIKQMKLKPCLGDFYFIWKGNTLGLFYSSQCYRNENTSTVLSQR